MQDLEFTPLSLPPSQTATDQVFDALYSAVVSLQLPPGSKVSEAEVAKQLNVSRQPVRDAFFRLSKLGLLSIRPQRATLISKISERAVREAAFVRTALEVECIRLAAARRTKEDIAELHEALARQVAALDDPDRRAFHVQDEAFHLLLCRIAGHTHVWELILEHKAHMDRARFLTLSVSHRRRVLSEHVALVEAIEAGSPDAAEACLRDHLGNIHVVLPGLRAENAAYFEDDCD
ncbi:GntR family transcriptional regulator [Seohaeicola zhoushanensis]|uniref:GntR family transcriptional regulator n=1 Tax=Seohaeicola zhoushanensis TaxID=1569283 RepID=A0A8J3GYU5_9RHOB|nr:GntR family transcriptional regulator [Seohaeicola zhoushanensis]GHF52918.1 GntR family transcriptional regulator [Seohaeicola zhoushanensis]